MKKDDVLNNLILFKPGKSIYTYMSSYELNHRHQQLTARYGIALHDTSLSIEERRLKNLIAKKYTEKRKQDRQYRSVIKVAKEYLYRQFKEYALLICLAMRKNNYFGMMGEQRVMIGFARNIFDIPPNDRMYQYHIDSLEDILEECDKRNGNKTGAEYIHMLKHFKFNLFGRDYSHSELSELNYIFELMETDLYLFRYYDRDFGSKLILGVVSRLEHANNDKAFIIKKELIRTPQFILNNAGKIHNNGCLIRLEALDLFFHSKWANFFRQTRIETKYALLHSNSTIREGLKEKALSYFDCNSYSDVLEKRDIFLQDMVNGILNHEIGGHKTANADKSSVHNAFWSSFFYGGENLGGALDEALADWAPVRDKRKGPFAYFLELSKTDLRRAIGNIYMYMSDCWFVDVDEDEEFLCFQSHALVGLTFMFLNADGSVDFARMERDSNKIYDFLLERLKILTDKAIGIIHNAIFDLGDKKIDYKTLENEIFSFYEYIEGYTLEKLLTYDCFWRQVYFYLKKYSKDGWDKYQKLLSEEGELVENMILKMADSDNKYKSLLEYIIERSKEIGVIKIQPEIEYRTAVKRACEDMNLSEDVQEQVRARFKEIIEDNKSIDVKINYQGSEDPFITVLQEMMIKRGYVENGILIGQFDYDDATSEDVKEFIFKELEHLRDQLESGIYPGIAKLRVRNSIRSLVDELLTKIKFSNGENIASKINFVKYTEIEYALIEAVIPIKRGYFDYNTTQAIYRISKELHPYGGFVEEQCVIDRYFLDNLIEIYL